MSVLDHLYRFARCDAPYLALAIIVANYALLALIEVATR